MVWFDWLILVVPVCAVVWAALRTRRYVRGVPDFLSAGRLCGRYVISAGDVANGLSIVALVTYAEMNYRAGFAVAFWKNALLPLGMVIGLTGYCHYRFRATRAMSVGQFLEMRYSRGFRICAATLRSAAEMLANMIMPSLAARFFMQMLDLPPQFRVCGACISTFVALMVLFLSLAVAIICCGGTLALVVADTIQGVLLFPILAVFIVFILGRFSVSGQIVPVLADRVAGESFINPFDVASLRDFNLFTMVVVVAYDMVANRANWIGAGTSTAAKSPHEAKMSNVLGTWRGSVTAMFYLLVACALITFLNHPDFADAARLARRDLAERAAAEVLRDDPAALLAVEKAAERAGGAPCPDRPLSQADNPDTAFLEPIHAALLENSPSEGIANDRFQQCRTLFHQLALSATVRRILPPGLFGLFALLLFLSMLSTDGPRIYSAALTISQDIVLPLRRRPFSLRGHLWMIRTVSVCVALFFLCGSCFMKQLDYIQMFVSLALCMWTAGAGPVMVFGLYSRFGTTAGAWASLGASTTMSAAFVLVQRNWADVVYPAVERAGLVDRLDRALRAASSPFEPWIHWEMDAVKCPVNTIEFTFFLSLLCLALYVAVSKLTCRRPFDLDAMLHREKAAAGARPAASTLGKLVGITPEYTRGDRMIAWGVFLYVFVYSFGACFLGVVAWNAASPWPMRWWGRYFTVVNFVVPGVVAAVSTVWFGVGGALGLRRLFRDLAARREVDETDDGRVERPGDAPPTPDQAGGKDSPAT
ncbi:MAG: sodium:panthothenate symporter [Kiritimatiellae bacterium]|nr:sodium:panthothenate symporter [Kiritimatiellia bacterium]